jgi:hypothetical protein
MHRLSALALMILGQASPVEFSSQTAMRIAACGPSDPDRVALERVMRGPSYDHLGGGLHDGPGGPKRLETNAWFLNALVASYESKQDLFVRNVALDVVSFGLRDLKDAAGAFFRSQGSGASAAYFSFSRTEIESALGSARSREFFEHFSLSPEGFPVLIGSPFGGLAETRQTLVLRRLRRVRLPLDATIDRDANGVWIGALARAAHVLDRHDFMEAARRAATAQAERPGGSAGAAFGLAALARFDRGGDPGQGASKALEVAMAQSPRADAPDLTTLVFGLTDALRLNASDLRRRQLAHVMRELERRFPGAETLVAARCLSATVTAKAP